MHICLDYIPELLAQPDINKQVGIAMRLEHTYLHILYCELVICSSPAVGPNMDGHPLVHPLNICSSHSL